MLLSVLSTFHFMVKIKCNIIRFSNVTFIKVPIPHACISVVNGSSNMVPFLHNNCVVIKPITCYHFIHTITTNKHWFAHQFVFAWTNNDLDACICACCSTFTHGRGLEDVANTSIHHELGSVELHHPALCLVVQSDWKRKKKKLLFCY